MQTRAYHTLDKSAWGPGAWQDEPDKMQWQDEATGLPCLLVRHPTLGQICGYVGVAPGHPAHAKPYDDDVLCRVDVHGGLTFSGACSTPENEAHGICHVPEPGEPEDVHWLGFDCGHYMDLSPGLRATLRDIAAKNPGQFGHDPVTWPETYRDAAYVMAECGALARQLATMAKPENLCRDQVVS